MRSVHVLIRGRVQGVSYRVWAKLAAEGRGLSGWVRNTHDGAVEAVFCGPAEAVEDMLADCRSGPSLARVEAVEVIGETEQVAGAFTILATR